MSWLWFTIFFVAIFTVVLSVPIIAGAALRLVFKTVRRNLIAWLAASLLIYIEQLLKPDGQTLLIKALTDLPGSIAQEATLQTPYFLCMTILVLCGSLFFPIILAGFGVDMVDKMRRKTFVFDPPTGEKS